jgi:hypothetical protein
VADQLVVCPVSSSHQFESAVSNRFEQFMLTAEYFASGCAFRDFATIRDEQLMASFLADFLGEGMPNWPSLISRVTFTDPHQRTLFPPRRILWRNSAEDVQLLRSVRKQSYDDVAGVFQSWKAHPERSIVEWKNSEIGPFRNHYAEQIIKLLRNSAAPEIGTRAEVFGFVNSLAFSEVPFLKISSWLYATAARKATHQVEPPSRGFLNDVEFIACLLPYCDALFVDRQCSAYLNELQSAGRLVFDTRVFSLANKEDLLSYLDEN